MLHKETHVVRVASLDDLLPDFPTTSPSEGGVHISLQEQEWFLVLMLVIHRVEVPTASLSVRYDYHFLVLVNEFGSLMVRH